MFGYCDNSIEQDSNVSEKVLSLSFLCGSCPMGLREVCLSHDI